MNSSASLRFGRLTAAVILLLLLSVLGCSSSEGTVSGKVSNVGTPITAGTVNFFPQTGAAVIATIGPDGTYTASGVPVGKVRVAVLPPRKENPAAKMGWPPDPSKMSPDIKNNKQEYGDIPEIYRDPATSKLEIEVTGGRQKFDIDMK